MHDRISVNGICFIDSSFRNIPSFREQAGLWRELGVRRVSLIADLLEKEGVAAAQDALASGDDLRRLYDLVVFPGHTEYVSQHAYDVVERYLVDGITPAKDLTCPGLPLPAPGDAQRNSLSTARQYATQLGW